MNNLSRRQLLKLGAATAGAMAVPYVISSGALAAEGKPGSNERIGSGTTGVDASRPFAEEPTFEQMYALWPKMQRPATFVGVPGCPYTVLVLWNGSAIFTPMTPHTPNGPPWGGMPEGLQREWEGLQHGALHMQFTFGDSHHYPDRMNNVAGEIKQSLVDGWLPIPQTVFQQDGIRWQCTVVARLAQGDVGETGRETLLVDLQWRGENTSGAAAKARLSAHLTAPSFHAGYKNGMFPKAVNYPQKLRLDGNFMLHSDGQARLAASSSAGAKTSFHVKLPTQRASKVDSTLEKLGLDRNVLIHEAELVPGASLTVRYTVPFAAIARAELEQAAQPAFDAILAARKAWWLKELESAGTIRTPERIVNDTYNARWTQAMMLVGLRPKCGTWVLKMSPNWYEQIWSGQSGIAAVSLDLRGKHTWSRKVLDALLAHQGPCPSAALGKLPATSALARHPGYLGALPGQQSLVWVTFHGWILWSLNQHALLTGDDAWLAKNADKLALACEWVGVARRAETGKAGLLPWARSNDFDRGHVFSNDAINYRGLVAGAEALRRVGHPRVGEFTDEAESYRKAIVAAVIAARDKAPRFPLADGSKIPYVPMSPEQLDYAKTSWTYSIMGALQLSWAGVIPYDHELISQTLAVLEAGRPKSPTNVKQRTPYWTYLLPEEPNWPVQGFNYAQRDNLPAALEVFYSYLSNGGNNVDLRANMESRDGVPCQVTGVAVLSWFMRDMLVREEGNDLILAGYCPRPWLADGKAIEAHNMPTHFGTVGYRVESKSKAGAIAGSFDFKFRKPPGNIRLRLRHPDGRTPRRVQVDGAEGKFAGEWLEVPPGARQFAAEY